MSFISDNCNHLENVTTKPSGYLIVASVPQELEPIHQLMDFQTQEKCLRFYDNKLS